MDINAKTAQATAKELNAKGIRSIAVTADITQAKECQRSGCGQTIVCSCQHVWKAALPS